MSELKNPSIRVFFVIPKKPQTFFKTYRNASMNRSHRSIWNDDLGSWVAVPENTRAKGKAKRSARRVGRQFAASLLSLAALATGTVSAGTSVQIDEIANGTANGTGSTAPATSANFAIAIGGGSGATAGVGSVAIGDGSRADATNATAVGRAAQARANESVAIGHNATVPSNPGAANNIAIGSSATTGLTYASGKGGSQIAIGRAATTQAYGAIAIGDNARAVSNHHTIALGNNSTASGNSAVAVGRNAAASGNYATALGDYAKATHENSVALGVNSTTAAAVGTASATIAGTAYKFAGTTPGSTVSVGNVGAERTITNVAAGRLNAGSTDAVNGSQLFATNSAVENLAISVTKNATHYYSVNDNGIQGGNHDNKGATGINALAAGVGTSATALDATALGSGAVAQVEGGVALGAGTVARTAAGIAGYVPPSASAQQQAAILATRSTRGALSVGDAANGVFRQINGVAAGTADSDAVNLSQLKAVADAAAAGASKWIIGSQTDAQYVAPTASGTQSTAVGSGAAVTANNSVAVGTGAVASTDNSVALGNGSTTAAATPTAGTTIRGTAYEFAGAAPVGVVSVGDKGAERQVTNVAAGRLDAGSTDVVNGSQLHATNQAINNITTGGGGIKYFHANSTAADSQAAGAESVAIGPNAVATAANGVAIGQGATADRNGLAGQTEAFSNQVVNSTKGALSVGSAGNERQITNVAGGTQATDAVNVRQLAAVQNQGVKYDTHTDGDVNNKSVTLEGDGGTVIHNLAEGVAPTDAANVGQLNQATASAKAYTDGRVGQLRDEVNGNAKDASAGTAGAMAMAGMPQAYLPGKSMMAAGVAGYDGQGALAIGVSRLSDNGRWVMKFAGSANSRGKIGVAAGAGFHW
jgi:autotransporter adhesin